MNKSPPFLLVVKGLSWRIGVHSLIVLNVLLLILLHERILLVQILKTLPVHVVFIILLNHRLSGIIDAWLIFSHYRDVVIVCTCVEHIYLKFMVKRIKTIHTWVSSTSHSAWGLKLLVTDDLDIVYLRLWSTTFDDAANNRGNDEKNHEASYNATNDKICEPMRTNN